MSDQAVGVEFGVSEFVALLNQTMDFAFPNVIITGELANLRVSKNRWVYFDLKDENSTVKFFGTVYMLPGPLEDGMLIKVRGTPKLHNLYGFSVNASSIQPAGEGSIRRAADLLKAKLVSEGLFDESRKRQLPYPPVTAGLIASKQSAAYADFIKILDARWQGITVQHIDVQVQGEAAPGQIVGAIEQFNASAQPPEVLIIIRGGGSPEDLAAYSTEQVTRAVAASRIPTLVAIGHEVDISLAELAADRHASTPSNAAELLVPDRVSTRESLSYVAQQLMAAGDTQITLARQNLLADSEEMLASLNSISKRARDRLDSGKKLLESLNPSAILARGYAIVRTTKGAIRSVKGLNQGDIVDVTLSNGAFAAKIETIDKRGA